MDLLTGYGSDASDAEDDQTVAPSSAGLPYKGPQGATQPARQQQQQQHQHPGPAPSQSKAVAASDADEPTSTGGGRSSGLWAQLPRPTAQQGAPSTTASGLVGLPPPLGGDARGGARKVVALQLPFRKELLAAALDSDDEDEPAAKRVKATGAKSRLMDFLPPPKYDTGLVRALGAGAGAREPPALGAGKASGSTRAEAAACPAGGSAAGGSGGGDNLPADFFTGGAEPYGNEAYRVRGDHDTAHAVGAGAGTADYYPDAASAGPYSYGAYDQSAYHAHDYGPAAAGPMAGGRGGAAAAAAAGQAAPAGPEDLIAEALRAEQERAAKRGGGGGGGVKLVEISAKELTRMDPAAREAASSARDALGPEYALSLRRSAAPFEGNKMARRKHQIGTLLFNARMQELDQMEKRTQGQKSKAETAAKYGW